MTAIINTYSKMEGWAIRINKESPFYFNDAKYDLANFLAVYKNSLIFSQNPIVLNEQFKILVFQNKFCIENFIKKYINTYSYILDGRYIYNTDLSLNQQMAVCLLNTVIEKVYIKIRNVENFIKIKETNPEEILYSLGLNLNDSHN